MYLDIMRAWVCLSVMAAYPPLSLSLIDAHNTRVHTYSRNEEKRERKRGREGKKRVEEEVRKGGGGG